MRGEDAYGDRTEIRKVVSNNRSELLMKMVAKEMAASLLRSGTKATEEVSRDKQHDMVANTDVDTLLDMVLIAVDRSSPSSSHNVNRQLRRMLREGLEHDEETSETAKETFVESSYALSSRATSSGTGSTQSGLSKSSEAKVNGDEPMDIWHPNFWATDVENLEPQSESSTHRTHSTRGTSRSKVLDEFLNNCNEISAEYSEEGENEECSVLSEISGLTGVFSDYPSEKDKQTNAAKRKDPLVCTSQDVSPSAVLALARLINCNEQGSKSVMISCSVRFKEVDIREYDRILSDNPACTNGPAIGIGWNFIEMGTRNIDEWEMERRRFRKIGDLMLSRKYREELLYSLGYKDSDLAAAIRSINKVKTQRRQTVNNLGMIPVEEVVESAKLKMKRLLFRKA